MKKEKNVLNLETFKISKLTNLKTITGGDDDNGGGDTIIMSTKKCIKGKDFQLTKPK